MSLVIIRIDAEFPLKFRARLIKFLFVEQQQTEIVVGFGLTGIELQRDTKMLGRSSRFAQGTQHLPQADVSRSIVQVAAEKIFVERGGLARVHAQLFSPEDLQVIRVVWQNLKPELAHLVRALRSEDHAAGRLVRIANVFVRVVVSVAHRERGSCRQKKWFPVAVLSLPVEIPMLDKEQPL